MHEGHRERLRTRFIKEGADSFAAHNLLELLLFYSIPRRDTNETAHKLLKQFGDVHAVLKATEEELCKVEGVNTNTATLLRLCGELGKRFCSGDLRDPTQFYCFDDVGNHLIKQFLSIPEERVFALLLDNSARLIKTVHLCKGSVNSIALNLRDVVKEATGTNAAGIILAHNHPDGNTFPSTEDLNTTKNLFYTLKQQDIELVEHFIVAETSYRRIKDMALINKKEKPKSHFTLPDY